MSKKIDDLQQWVQDYEVPEEPENRMEKLRMPSRVVWR